MGIDIGTGVVLEGTSTVDESMVSHLPSAQEPTALSSRNLAP